MISSISSVYSEALEKYKSETPEKLKLLDLYMVFCVLLGVLQAVYLLVVGTYPYNAFLAGFGSAVASFVLSGKQD
ncbi:Dolichyl-diphosphooligosaccharide-protein glycosyltransferase subunit DAD1 [Zancudomyces culisetae]|uniref:Dolichyl-diphosphooligosaccharide--protein glycosyltransferase subunit OST2 n=1 Tax=Zancudomyces culisetae TaxID=1213189 RepID=A0A1R1PI51_ZANCU|nr:Dolichyl-diphosphooligosaccharide-protein glycosyltransferase subunit DAD1 [Zancudomyces culisetae]|eukprot:OMH80628.1 Dolichyl-diphosphooligosaccharide-protein glycosyltransferase subunit DAD1 [Zancudomyces culisetae]